MVVPLLNIHGISKTQSWETQWQLQRIIQKASSSTPMFEIACLKLLEDEQYWEGRIFHVPNFALGQNFLITFYIFI